MSLVGGNRYPRNGVAAECAAPVLPPIVSGRVENRPAAGQDRDFRNTRVRRLQELLADGAYPVPPDQIAGKMIGRAICDQVSRVFDS